MENQRIVENHLAHTIGQTENESRYDKATKKLLANKLVLAHIMKGCVEEYRSCPVNEIAEKYIEGEPEIGAVGVHADDTNRAHRSTADSTISGSNSEDATLTEGTIYYDVRFNAIAPKSDAEPEELIRLIINVEAQNKFKPGYPLTKRAIYYCSRMISAQHGSVFTKSEYEKIKKVYSIWVCTNPPEEFQNSVTRYSIKAESIIGNAAEKTENYDLMSAVMVCLGKPGAENYTGILKFLEVLLSSSRAAEEKKKILTEDFGVPMTTTLEREVLEMCNLSQGVKEEGIEIGIRKGMEEGKFLTLAELVKDGTLSVDVAAAKAKMTADEFRKAMKSTLQQTN